MKPQDEYDGPFPKSVFPPSAFPRRIFPWMGGDDDGEDESKTTKPEWERNNSDDENHK